MEIRDLPAFHASLNAVATVLLTAAYIAIRRGAVRVHRTLMLTASAVSIAFLTSYLIYHRAVGSIRFTHEGWPKTLYLGILAPHIVLAATLVPLIVLTLRHALRDDRERHRRLARITWPIWMFVSITGVLVYLMLYRWFPSAELAG